MRNKYKPALRAAKKIFKAKESFHKTRAKMPVEEKIALLVEMQKLANSIPGRRKHRVWKLS